MQFCEEIRQWSPYSIVVEAQFLNTENHFYTLFFTKSFSKYILSYFSVNNYSLCNT